MATAWTFQFRWLLWTAGAFGIGACLVAWTHREFREVARGRIDALDRAVAPRFASVLGIVTAGFVALGWLGKYSQLLSLRLNAQDFWLFEDLLRNLTQGGLFLTRFAPQASGMIQHGAVHATWSFALAAPLAWLFGPTQAALLYGPLCLGTAAVFLGLLTRPRWGALAALTLAAAFLCSTQVGHVLSYDVHPEVAYPLAVFAWAWALGLGDGRIRWSAVVVTTLFGMGIKEDAFLAFFPWMGWAVLRLQGKQRKAAGISLVLGLTVAAFSMVSIGRFASGAWGPREWEGLKVILPPGADLLKGIHWDSPTAAFQVLDALSARAGGLRGVLSHWAHFWISRPWLSILVLVPWVLRESRFYLLVLPLTLAYSLLERAAILNLYYSAPFLGSVWAAAALSSQISRRRASAGFALLAALTLGNGAIELHFPSESARPIQMRAQRLSQCLPAGHGVVQTTLLGAVPRDRVFSERKFEDAAFYLLTPGIISYELQPSPLLAELQNDPRWIEVDVDCKPAKRPAREVALWVRQNQ